MKSIQIIITSALIAFSGLLAKAQTVSDSVKVTYRNKTVTVKPVGDESSTTIKFKDTANNRKVLVKVTYVDNGDIIERNIEKTLDSSSKKVYDLVKYKNKKERKRFIETSFLPTIDLGFVTTMNEVDNNFAFTPKLNKSANINIGIVRQNMNLYNDQILLSYGLNLNNYYIKYADKQKIQYLDNNGHLNVYRDTVNNYDKNRLDIRYLSVPVLLEFHSKNDKFNIAAGVEFGFNGYSKLVQKGDRNSLEFKQKGDNDIKVNPTQINAVLRIGIDKLALFGKYSITDMYQNSAYASGNNPHQHLFSFGVCLFGI